MNFKKLNFRNKLLLATLPVTAIALIITSFLTYEIARESIIAQTELNLAQRVNNDKQLLDTWIHDVREQILFFNSNPVIKSAVLGEGIDSAAKYLKNINVKLTIYESIFVADNSGKIIFDSVDGKSVGLSIRDNPGFRENYFGTLKGNVFVGKIHASSVSGHPVFLITAPIFIDGKITGIAGTIVKFNHYSKENITDMPVGKYGYAFVSNETGIAIAHPNSKHILNLDFKTLSFGKQMLEQKTGSLRYNFEGKDSLASLAYMEEEGLILAAKLELEEVLAPIKKIRYVALCVGVTSFMVLLIVIVFFTGKLVTVLRGIIANLSSGAEQIGSASKQTAQSSQQMAQGANEQASSLEETSSSLEEMSAMINQNAENSKQANSLAVMAREAAVKGNNKMTEMVDAINKIKDSSDETSKIIKTIDEIAFQTNLLALNAAVEAARAGEAGKGFAVVAEEVRNLAQRSAEAARNTSTLIETSKQNAENGVQVTGNVRDSLNEIFEGVDKVSHLVEEVSVASEEQAKGIDQVNTAVAEMNKLTQSNAAHSEETASASEELSAQANELNHMVDVLVEVVEGQSEKKQVRINGNTKAKRSYVSEKANTQVNSDFLSPQAVMPLDDDELSNF